MLKRILFIFLIIFSLNNEALTQSNNYSFTTNLGIGTPALDNGLAIQLGVNPFIDATNRFALEGQLSVMNTRGSTFISGRTFTENLVLVGAGGRVYFVKPEKKWRPYFKFLGGLTYVMETEEDASGTSVELNRFEPGIAIGLFIAKQNSFSFGLGIESSEHFLLKLGYTFN